MVPRLPFLEDGCAPSGSVGLDQAGQEVKARFINKHKGSALLAGLLLDLGPSLGPPAPDRGFIPLDGAGHRNLGRPTQRFEQAGNLAFAVVEAELLLQDRHHPQAGPNLAAKTIRFGSVPQKVGNQTLLLLAQPARATGTRSLYQRLQAALAYSPAPLADRSFGYLQGNSNVTLFQSQLVKMPSLPAAPFFGGKTFYPHFLSWHPRKTLATFATLSSWILFILKGCPGFCFDHPDKAARSVIRG